MNLTEINMFFKLQIDVRICHKIELLLLLFAKKSNKFYRNQHVFLKCEIDDFVLKKVGSF